MRETIGGVVKLGLHSFTVQNKINLFEQEKTCLDFRSRFGPDLWVGNRKESFNYSKSAFGNIVKIFSTIPAAKLSEKEIAFLKLCKTDSTYQAMQSELGLTKGALDSMRESLFSKANAKTKTTLILWAIKNGFIDL